MTTPTPGADLQTALAAYMSRHAGRPIGLDELATATHSGRAEVHVMLTRIVNGEARPYPIIREGRAAYTWVHDPADHPACVQVLTDTLRYITFLGEAHARVLAVAALSHQLILTVNQVGGTAGWRCRCGLEGHVEDLRAAGSVLAEARRFAWADHDKKLVPDDAG